MNWKPEAEAKLKEIPFFVRPAARKRIEGMANEAGLDVIDEAFFRGRQGQVRPEVGPRSTLVGFDGLAAAKSLLKGDGVKGFSFRDLSRSCRSRSASKW